MKNCEFKKGDSIVRVKGARAEGKAFFGSEKYQPGEYIRAELKHFLEPENWPDGSIVHSSYHNQDAIYYGRSKNGSLRLKYDGTSEPSWYSVGSYSLVRLPSAWLNAESEPLHGQLSVQAKNDLQRSMNKLATDALRQAFGLGERGASPAPKGGIERLGHVLDFNSMTCRTCGHSTAFIAERNLTCPGDARLFKDTMTKINARFLDLDEVDKLSKDAALSGHATVQMAKLRSKEFLKLLETSEPDPWEYREKVSHLNTPKMYTDEAIGDAIDTTLERAAFEAWPYADNTLRHGIV